MKRLATPILYQIALVHLISHVHIMVIPALLPLLPDLLHVKFVELGIAVSVFNVVSAFVQAPLGFATDKYGARAVLCAGLAIGSTALLSFAFFPSFMWLLVVAALTGAANGVYHPGDYALLSQSVPDAHMGRAFSIHSFAGFFGAAITPMTLAAIATLIDVRAAFAVAGGAGLLTLAAFASSRPAWGEMKNRVRQKRPAKPEALQTAPASQATPGKPKVPNNSGTPVSVFTLNVAVLTFLFVLLNLNATALERFSVSAFVKGYNIPLTAANTALTAFLFCSSFGVLCGGYLADRTKRHGLLAAIATGIAGLLVCILLFFSPPAFALIPLWAVVGFLTGVIVPSRDMLVRAAAPPGAYGKTFGIVSTGFNIGGAFGPIVFGYFLDHAMFEAVFATAVICLACIVIVTLMQEKKIFN